MGVAHDGNGKIGRWRENLGHDHLLAQYRARGTRRTQCAIDDRLDLVPCPTRQTAADTWHVDAGPQCIGLSGDFTECRFHRFVADGRLSIFRHHSVAGDVVLANHVGDPNVWLDLHKLNSAKSEIVRLSVLMPRSICSFRLRPSLGNGDDTPLAPAANVVTNRVDDLVPIRCGSGRITDFVLNVRHHRPHETACENHRTPVQSTWKRSRCVPSDDVMHKVHSRRSDHRGSGELLFRHMILAGTLKRQGPAISAGFFYGRRKP